MTPPRWHDPDPGIHKIESGQLLLRLRESGPVGHRDVASRTRMVWRCPPARHRRPRMTPSGGGGLRCSPCKSAPSRLAIRPLSPYTSSKVPSWSSPVGAPAEAREWKRGGSPGSAPCVIPENPLGHCNRLPVHRPRFHRKVSPWGRSVAARRTAGSHSCRRAPPRSNRGMSEFRPPITTIIETVSSAGEAPPRIHGDQFMIRSANPLPELPGNIRGKLPLLPSVLEGSPPGWFAQGLRRQPTWGFIRGGTGTWWPPSPSPWGSGQCPMGTGLWDRARREGEEAEGWRKRLVVRHQRLDPLEVESGRSRRKRIFAGLSDGGHRGEAPHACRLGGEYGTARGTERSVSWMVSYNWSVEFPGRERAGSGGGATPPPRP